jgi:hypothetical protein
MQAKKVVCFLVALLLSLGLNSSVNALTDTNVSFTGGGIKIDLTYPEEAHPEESIVHNVTITANVNLTLQNFTMIVYAPVNSSWQEATSLIIGSRDMTKNQNRIEEIRFTLPKHTSGTLNCLIHIQSNQTSDTLTYKFFTTRVSELTFSEMQTLYNDMLANYTILKADYETKLSEYNGLLTNFSSLLANYTALLSEHNQLTKDYNSQVSTYEALLAKNNKLSNDYDTLSASYNAKTSELGNLQTNYNELNTTRYGLQTSLDTLQAVYDALNQTYTNLQHDFNDLQKNLNDLQKDFKTSEGIVGADRVVMLIFIVTLAALIVFIVYIKRKKQEPYLVIRKETVNVNDENS